jgi:hypothetical protein
MSKGAHDDSPRPPVALHPSAISVTKPLVASLRPALKVIKECQRYYKKCRSWKYLILLRESYKSLPVKADDSLEDKTATTSSKESAVTELSSLGGFWQVKSLQELRRGEV